MSTCPVILVDLDIAYRAALTQRPVHLTLRSRGVVGFESQVRGEIS